QSVTADLGRLGARPALVDRRQRQQPSRLSGVHRALRQPAQLPRRVIPRSPTAAPMTNPHWFATVNHIPRALGIPSVSRSYGDWVLIQRIAGKVHMALAHQPGRLEERRAERRNYPRRRVLKNALIVFNNGHSTMNCQILDMSANGARLLPGDPFFCPSEFVLKPQIGEPHYCEVRWRKGMEVGVCYL